MMEFSDWITKKYIAWRGDRMGNEASIAKFADLFGASQQVMSEWMKKGGGKPRSQKYVNALVKVYGNEVYEILGYRHTERDVPWEDVPEEYRRRLEAFATEVSRASHHRSRSYIASDIPFPPTQIMTFPSHTTARSNHPAALPRTQTPAPRGPA